MRALLNFISGLFMFYLLYLFLKWYIKGHFGKYFILFWAYSIFTVFMYFNHQHKTKSEYDSRSGQEIWDERMKNYDAVRGY